MFAAGVSVSETVTAPIPSNLIDNVVDADDATKPIKRSRFAAENSKYVAANPAPAA